LAESLDEDSLAVINADNPHILGVRDKIKSRVVGVGFSDKADMAAADVIFNYAEGSEIKGLSFKLSYKGTTLPVRLDNILAKHQIYPALIAVAVGTEFGINLVESTAVLTNFLAPSSRLNLIPGVKNSTIIDDTYNASPSSAKAALEVMGKIKALRKIAVLGDMLELGEETEKSHRGIARNFLDANGNIFFAVGERMKFAVAELEESGFGKENIFFFTSPMEAARKLQEIIKEGDLVLIKGSQGMRMEKIVEEVMADPQKAEELLCRQNKEWKEKPWKPV
jgi:UDP-N-acetylmuramoyl-tripeptide--D-alanyl-D-alanine ligase